jgi:hypothetical protein
MPLKDTVMTETLSTNSFYFPTGLILVRAVASLLVIDTATSIKREYGLIFLLYFIIKYFTLFPVKD